MAHLSEATIRRGDIEIAYRRGGDGPPLVFLHGFPLDGAMWQAQWEELSEHHDVIVPDLRGFGRSSLADDDVEQGVAMHRYAADAVALLSELNIEEPVALVGFSMGGYAAFQFALHHQSRLGALVLVDTRAGADTPEARAGRLAMADEVLAAGNVEAAFAMMPKLLAPSTVEKQGDVVEQLETMIRRQSPEAVAAAQRGMAARHDVGDQLAEIAVATLLIGGVDDAITPPDEMKQLAEVLPDGRFVEIADAGHMSPMENSAAVNAAIREFLGSVG